MISLLKSAFNFVCPFGGCWNKLRTLRFSENSSPQLTSLTAQSIHCDYQKQLVETEQQPVSMHLCLISAPSSSSCDIPSMSPCLMCDWIHKLCVVELI